MLLDKRVSFFIVAVASIAILLQVIGLSASGWLVLDFYSETGDGENSSALAQHRLGSNFTTTLKPIDIGGLPKPTKPNGLPQGKPVDNGGLPKPWKPNGQSQGKPIDNGGLTFPTTPERQPQGDLIDHGGLPVPTMPNDQLPGDLIDNGGLPIPTISNEQPQGDLIDNGGLLIPTTPNDQSQGDLIDNGGLPIPTTPNDQSQGDLIDNGGLPIPQRPNGRSPGDLIDNGGLPIPQMPNDQSPGDLIDNGGLPIPQMPNDQSQGDLIDNGGLPIPQSQGNPKETEGKTRPINRSSGNKKGSNNTNPFIRPTLRPSRPPVTEKPSNTPFPPGWLRPLKVTDRPNRPNNTRLTVRPSSPFVSRTSRATRMTTAAVASNVSDSTIGSRPNKTSLDSNFTLSGDKSGLYPGRDGRLRGGLTGDNDQVESQNASLGGETNGDGSRGVQSDSNDGKPIRNTLGFQGRNLQQPYWSLNLGLWEARLCTGSSDKETSCVPKTLTTAFTMIQAVMNRRTYVQLSSIGNMATWNDLRVETMIALLAGLVGLVGVLLSIKPMCLREKGRVVAVVAAAAMALSGIVLLVPIFRILTIYSTLSTDRVTSVDYYKPQTPWCAVISGLGACVTLVTACLVTWYRWMEEKGRWSKLNDENTVVYTSEVKPGTGNGNSGKGFSNVIYETPCETNSVGTERL